MNKRYKENLSKIKIDSEYKLKDAISLMKSFSPPKFDESIDISVNLGVDPRHADQLVRGTVSLPNGTGKNIKVIVLTKDEDKIKIAKESGAEEAGFDELFPKIQKGWVDFDVMVASPDVMPEVGKLGRVLGPRGLMPNPKSGTVTLEVGKAVSDVKKGKIDFKVDQFGIIHASVGKVSFDAEKLSENTEELLQTIMKLRPTSTKGTYVHSISLSSTMGVGVEVDSKSLI